jgi:hypothetical protein
MNEKQLFGLALGLTLPWFIDRVEFDPEKRRLDLFLDFERDPPPMIGPPVS